MKVLPIHSELG